MATKPTYTVVTTVQERVQTLVGYKVVADYQKDGARTLVLERPETPPGKKVTRKVKRTPATPPEGTKAQEGAS